MTMGNGGPVVGRGDVVASLRRLQATLAGLAHTFVSVASRTSRSTAGRAQAATALTRSMCTTIHLGVPRGTQRTPTAHAHVLATAEPRSRSAATTRQALLEAARPLFAQHGYEATTVSQVARAAGFSPNLVTRYFGGKEGLFLAATRTRLDLSTALSGGIDGFGRRLANQMVDRWEAQGQADPLLALLRSASARPAALEALGEFLEQEATAPVTRELMASGFSEHEAVDRANAVQSFVVGVVVTRRMLHTGAVAIAGGAQLRAWLAEILQRLVGDAAPSAPTVGHLSPAAGRHRAADPPNPELDDVERTPS